tara:strand:+ start:79 stop:471 length:393 start_codon:yes stop_codon:yes gene_type:complete
MAIGALTLDQRKPERIGRNLSILTGSIDLAGTAVGAGAPVATTSDDGYNPSGKKISDFFGTLHLVVLENNVAAHLTADGADEHATVRYVNATDAIMVYGEDEGTGVTTIQTTGTVVGDVKFIAYGTPRGK